MKRLATIIISICCVFLLHAQKISCDTSYLKFCLYTLADDSMCGRAAGSEFEEKAAIFIANQFKKNNIQPYFDKNYFQVFGWTDDTVEKLSCNVGGFINNKASKTIVFVAHYDHIGMGGKRSRSYGKHEVHNGADDNASGVALMLFLAQNIKKQNLENYNFLFLATGAHEPGLWGSTSFVNSPYFQSQSITMLINMDMLGRADRENPVLFYASNNAAIDSLFTSGIETNYPCICKKRELPEGDHSPFSKQNIPVLFVTTGIHDDYHKCSDDPDKINCAFISVIATRILTILHQKP